MQKTTPAFSQAEQYKEQKIMTTYKQQILALVLGFAFCISGFVLPVRADQPLMQAARNDLNKAYNALKRATPDKGGHREKAMNLVSQAINAVNDGIQYDRQNPNNRRRRNSDLDLSNLVENSGIMVTDQPNMQMAKDRLQDALSNLQKASPDKGGYRTKAIDLVKDAISEVQKGIEYDRRN
jgi:hypothetical protein